METSSNTLREVLHNTIHCHPTLKVPVIAERIGISENYLYRAALPDQEDSDTGTGCRFPLKKLIPLIQTTQDFSVLDHIEQSVGRVAVRIPQGAASNSEICKLAMESVKEFGELMAELDSSLNDRKLTRDEVERINKEGYEAVQAIMALLHNLKAGKK